MTGSVSNNVPTNYVSENASLRPQAERMAVQTNMRLHGPRVFPMQDSNRGDVWLRDSVSISAGQSRQPQLWASYNAADHNLRSASSLVEGSANHFSEVGLMLTLARTMLEDAAQTTNESMRERIQAGIDSIMQQIDQSHMMHNQTLTQALGRNSIERIILINNEESPTSEVNAASLAVLNETLASGVQPETFSGISFNDWPEVMRNHLEFIYGAMGALDHIHSQHHRIVNEVAITPENEMEILAELQDLTVDMIQISVYLADAFLDFHQMMSEFISENPPDWAGDFFTALGIFENQTQYSFTVDNWILHDDWFQHAFIQTVNDGATAVANATTVEAALDGLGLALFGRYHDQGTHGYVGGIGGMIGAVRTALGYAGEALPENPRIPDGMINPPPLPSENPPWQQQPDYPPNQPPPDLNYPEVFPPRDDLELEQLDAVYFQVGIHSGQGWTLAISRVNTAVLGLGDGSGNTDISVIGASNRNITNSIQRIENAISFVAVEQNFLQSATSRLESDRNRLNRNQINSNEIEPGRGLRSRDEAHVQSSFERLARTEAMARMGRNMQGVFGSLGEAPM